MILHRWVSLEEYVERMPEWQKSIFYIAGESIEVRNSQPVGIITSDNVKPIKTLDV